VPEDSTRRRLRAAAFAALGTALAACSPAPRVLVLEGPTMGTTWSVKAVVPTGQPLPAGLDAEIAAQLEGLDRALSNYDPEAELSRLNRAAGGAWIPVSPDLFAVLRAARAANAWSGGAVDVTVGPLVDLWGFGPSGRHGAPPTRATLRAARARVGQALLELRDTPPAVRKARADVSIDLSAIAVGYAVDRVAEHLESRGIERYLVDIGGELRAAGASPAGGRWRIAVQRPDAPEHTVERIVLLAGGAIATSGDYRDFYERDGRRYAHVIDPRTGEPVLHGPASVSVVAPTAEEADAAATALLVLGPDAGLRVAAERGLPALFVVRGKGGPAERMTPDFATLLARAGAHGEGDR